MDIEPGSDIRKDAPTLTDVCINHGVAAKRVLQAFTVVQKQLPATIATCIDPNLTEQELHCLKEALGDDDDE